VLHAQKLKSSIFFNSAEAMLPRQESKPWKLGCRVCAVVALTYAVIMFNFHFSTLASPNFEVLVNLQVLPAKTSTFGRMWYTIAQISFWICFMMTGTLIFLATNWKAPQLLEPFCYWSLVAIIWELVLIGFKIANFSGSSSGFVILWRLINIGFWTLCIAVMVKYATALKTEDDQVSQNNNYPP
jgi:hypothetical protein